MVRDIDFDDIAFLQQTKGASCRRFGSSIRDLMKMSVEAMAKKLLASSRSNACALLR